MNKEFWDKLKELYNKEDGNYDAFNSEKEILEKALDKIQNELKDIYDFGIPLGRGGAGIVIRLKDKRLDAYRALKLPRPKDKELIDSVKNEIEHLNKIRHENIISIYTLGEVAVPDYLYPYPYFVMDYIKEAQDLKKKVLLLTEEFQESTDLDKITKWVAQNFASIANAINFLHKHKTIHFDIKPSNILIDEDGKPILGDLGFAKTKTEETEKNVVGFTIFYAHPTLKHEYLHMSSRNRVRRLMSPEDYQYVFDIYAFGKSLLEILSLIDQKFPDVVVYDYTFVYLHFLACRLLDGKNLPLDETNRIREKLNQDGEEPIIYKEEWLELKAKDLEEIKYKNFSEVSDDFKKILIPNILNESINELSTYYPKRIQSSKGIPAPFSNRVKFIVEHPVFSRLSFVAQLGLLNYIYPTATHTRLEHSIGVFRNCCLYLQSLINDPYNPVFRQLINEYDIKCVLLASLFHDLGQYPLAHEMEEINIQLKHENFTVKFLNNQHIDVYGHTIKEIVEDKEWGWGVRVDDIIKILQGKENPNKLFEEKDIKTKILSSLVDGPIDVDKLDYLLRDSQNCYLNYGDLIDSDRLIRNLTIIITKNEKNKTRISVGAYEKGQSAAESLTFARYLLYQSLYWHHTARAIRVMIMNALKPALIPIRKGKNNSFLKQFENLLGLQKEPNNITNDDVLNLIEKWTDDQGKKLIKMLKLRKFYKRILTIHSYQSPAQGKKSLLDKFRYVLNKPGFQDSFQNRIREAYENYLEQTQSSKISLLAPKITNKAIEILNEPNKILCDCPQPQHGAKEMLRFIPEPQRLQKNYFIRGDTGERVSEVWNQVYYKLMDIVSKGRIYCHPDIRDTIMATIGPDGLKSCLENVIEDHDN